MKRGRLSIAVAAFLAGSLGAVYAATTNTSTMQFPTAGWGAYAPARVQCGTLKAANFNVTTDQAIPIVVPSVLFMVDSISVNNASVSLTTAQGGFYTAASKGGTTLVASTQAYSTLTAAAVDSAGSAMTVTLGTGATTSALDVSTIYFSLTTAQGAAATADIRVHCRPLYG